MSLLICHAIMFLCCPTDATSQIHKRKLVVGKGGLRTSCVNKLPRVEQTLAQDRVQAQKDVQLVIRVENRACRVLLLKSIHKR